LHPFYAPAKRIIVTDNKRKAAKFPFTAAFTERRGRAETNGVNAAKENIL